MKNPFKKTAAKPKVKKSEVKQEELSDNIFSDTTEIKEETNLQEVTTPIVNVDLPEEPKMEEVVVPQEEKKQDSDWSAHDAARDEMLRRGH